MVACSNNSTTDESATNETPTANAGSDQSVSVGTIVELDASNSSDADGDALSYSWDFISVPANSAAALSAYTVVDPSFTPDYSGSYVLQVSVSDGATSSSDEITITATATSTTSTMGIECDYSYDAYNDSPSVNAQSTAAWECSSDERVLTANGIPDHETGTFPNDGNPNTISEQTVSATYTLNPELTATATQMGGPLGPQGHVLNGIKIDAGTGGSCDDSGEVCSLGDPSGNWSIEALGQESFDFGTDENNAHVQPDGTYHYHGMPAGFITLRGGDSTKMTLIGWAADGFPIYARYGYSDPEDATSPLKSMSGSFQLVSDVSSSRPATTIYPLGTFRQDWEYVEGSGDLDECNGRFGVTPEFPEGIYHYYATDSYPYFQRCVRGAVTAAGGPPGGGSPPGL